MPMDEDPLQISVRQLLGDEQPASNANAEVLIRSLVSTALPFGIPEQVPVGRQSAPYTLRASKEHLVPRSNLVISV